MQAKICSIQGSNLGLSVCKTEVQPLHQLNSQQHQFSPLFPYPFFFTFSSDIFIQQRTNHDRNSFESKNRKIKKTRVAHNCFVSARISSDAKSCILVKDRTEQISLLSFHEYTRQSFSSMAKISSDLAILSCMLRRRQPTLTALNGPILILFQLICAQTYLSFCSNCALLKMLHDAVTQHSGATMISQLSLDEMIRAEQPMS